MKDSQEGKFCPIISAFLIHADKDVHTAAGSGPAAIGAHCTGLRMLSTWQPSHDPDNSGLNLGHLITRNALVELVCELETDKLSLGEDTALEGLRPAFGLPRLLLLLNEVAALFDAVDASGSQFIHFLLSSAPDPQKIAATRAMKSAP